MYPNEQRYKRVMLRVGFAMLLHALLVNVLSVVQEFLLNPVFAALLDARRADVAQQLAEGVVYLTAFMLPGFFFYWISRKEDREPLPLKTVLTPRTPLVVMAGMAAILVFAMINAVAVSFFSVNDASQYVIGMEAKENYQVVLLFIRIAVIPAVCEEFLFILAYIPSLNTGILAEDYRTVSLLCKEPEPDGCHYLKASEDHRDGDAK